MSRFFLDSDFDAFDSNFAMSEDSKVYENRKYVQKERFETLNACDGGGLKQFFVERQLFPHWKKEHLTNVLHPYHIANGGWVDYIRMGYGKKDNLVKELAKRSGIYTAIVDSYAIDQMAFHCVTQLQVGLNYDGWWLNLYIDKGGWLEQNNLTKKIQSSKELYLEFEHLLEDVSQYGYDVVIYSHEEKEPIYFDYGKDFIQYLFDNISMQKNISIEKVHVRDDQNNNKQIATYLKTEFQKLIPLYNFISWHPSTNNYLGI